MTPPDSNNSRDLILNRTLVGLIAAACLVIALLLRLWSSDERMELWFTAFGRCGLLMTALWIALPKQGPFVLSRSTLLGVLVALLAISAQPKIILRALPVLLALGSIAHFLKPRPTARDDRPDRSSWKK